jgi:holo-[acyl-carrier protein] synthase
MIIGIGSDVIAVDRINKIISLREEAFIEKILTAQEITLLKNLNETRVAGYLANRFAAKESLSKALGTGIGKDVSFQDIEIFKTPQGKPYFILSNKLQNYIQSNYGEGVRIYLSMSNETEYAQAFVVIEK